ncbi:MAG: hypothetical protein ABI700_01905 [Chloroflexota bacterium]
MNTLKKTPKFKDEVQERVFWMSHTLLAYFDWKNALVNPHLPHLKPSIFHTSSLTGNTAEMLTRKKPE